MNNEKYIIATEKFNNGGQITLKECVMLDVLEELEVQNDNAETRVNCPKNNCNGTIIWKDSSNDYGCTDNTCKFHITKRRIRDWRKILSQEQHENE